MRRHGVYTMPRGSRRTNRTSRAETSDDGGCMAMQSNIEQYSATRRNPHCLCGSAQSLCGSSQSSICVAQRSVCVAQRSICVAHRRAVFVWLSAAQCLCGSAQARCLCGSPQSIVAFVSAAVSCFVFPPAHFPSLCPRLYGIAAITAYFHSFPPRIRKAL